MAQQDICVNIQIVFVCFLLTYMELFASALMLISIAW